MAKYKAYSRRERSRENALDPTWSPLESTWIARIPSLNSPPTEHLETGED